MNSGRSRARSGESCRLKRILRRERQLKFIERGRATNQVLPCLATCLASDRGRSCRVFRLSDSDIHLKTHGGAEKGNVREAQRVSCTNKRHSKHTINAQADLVPLSNADIYYREYRTVLNDFKRLIYHFRGCLVTSRKYNVAYPFEEAVEHGWCGVYG